MATSIVEAIEVAIVFGDAPEHSFGINGIMLPTDQLLCVLDVFGFGLFGEDMFPGCQYLANICWLIDDG